MTVGEAATSPGGDEGWLRNLLNASQHALHDLRQIPGVGVQAPITDLEHVCAKVQRYLDALGQQGVSAAR